MCRNIINRVSINAELDNDEMKDTMNTLKSKAIYKSVDLQTKSANRYDTAQVRHLNNYTKYEKKWDKHEQNIKDHFLKK